MGDTVAIERNGTTDYIYPNAYSSLAGDIDFVVSDTLKAKARTDFDAGTCGTPYYALALSTSTNSVTLTGTEIMNGSTPSANGTGVLDKLLSGNYISGVALGMNGVTFASTLVATNTYDITAIGSSSNAKLGSFKVRLNTSCLDSSSSLSSDATVCHLLRGTAMDSDVVSQVTLYADEDLTTKISAESTIDSNGTVTFTDLKDVEGMKIIRNTTNRYYATVDLTDGDIGGTRLVLSLVDGTFYDKNDETLLNPIEFTKVRETTSATISYQDNVATTCNSTTSEQSYESIYGINILNAGTLNVAVENNNAEVKYEKNILANDNVVVASTQKGTQSFSAQNVAAFKFHASNEDIRVDMMKVHLSGLNNNTEIIQSVGLFADKAGTEFLAAGRYKNGNIAVIDQDFVIKADENPTVYVRVNTKKIGEGGVQEGESNIQLALELVQAYGVESGRKLEKGDCTFSANVSDAGQEMCHEGGQITVGVPTDYSRPFNIVPVRVATVEIEKVEEVLVNGRNTVARILITPADGVGNRRVDGYNNIAELAIKNVKLKGTSFDGINGGNHLASISGSNTAVTGEYILKRGDREIPCTVANGCDFTNLANFSGNNTNAEWKNFGLIDLDDTRVPFDVIFNLTGITDTTRIKYVPTIEQDGGLTYTTDQIYENPLLQFEVTNLNIGNNLDITGPEVRTY